MKLIEVKLDDLKEEQGVWAISLVETPAVEVNFVKLSEETIKLKLSLNEDKKIVMGPVLIPDQKIYRTAESMNSSEDAEIFFSAETIVKLNEKFLRLKNNNNITLGHNDLTNDSTLFESWIIEDPKKDKSSIYGFDLPAGTWMMSQKIHNNELWNRIKSGEFNGYSIEALLSSIVINNNIEKSIDDEILDLIKDITTLI